MTSGWVACHPADYSWLPDMVYIKIILHVFAVLGALIMLLDMLGYFKDKDHISFTKKIEKDLECSARHPGAKKFINDFIVKNPKYENSKFDITEIDKVKYVGFALSYPMKKQEHRVDSLVAGSLKIKDIHGHVSQSLCSYSELKQWEKESSLIWKWSGFVIVSISIILGIVLFLIEERSVRKKLNNTIENVTETG